MTPSTKDGGYYGANVRAGKSKFGTPAWRRMTKFKGINDEGMTEIELGVSDFAVVGDCVGLRRRFCLDGGGVGG